MQHSVRQLGSPPLIRAIRIVLAFTLATFVALMFSAPAQADNGNHYGQLKNGNNGHHYGQYKQVLPPALAPVPPAPVPPPAPAGTVISVDASQAGTLPVGTSDAAWSVNSHVTLIAQPCSGVHCIHVQLVSTTYCGVADGCAYFNADGSCVAQVSNGLEAYPAYRRAVLEHETGHCLGLPHNYTDPYSIMNPNFGYTNTPPGPDAGDLAAVRALYP